MKTGVSMSSPKTPEQQEPRVLTLLTTCRVTPQGVLKQCKGEEVFLGQFLYNRTGATVQTFKLQVRGALGGVRGLRPWEGCVTVTVTRA